MEQCFRECTGRSLRILTMAVLLSAALLSAQSARAQATLQIVNNFKSGSTATTYFSQNYSDDQVWLYFMNSASKVTYADSSGAAQTVADATPIQLSSVKDGTFNLAIGCVSTRVYAALGASNPFSGTNGPGLFDKNVPYALAEWTINGNQYDNTDLSYQDAFSFPTTLTVTNGSGEQTDQASFPPGTRATDVITALESALPSGPVGPNLSVYPTPESAAGWGPFVSTVSGDASAVRCIGSSKTWTSGPDVNNLRGLYIYAPSLNAYLKYLQANEPTLFSNGIKGWYIDYDGDAGYSGYLSVTGTDGNYGLLVHDIRTGAGGKAPNWAANPTAGTSATGTITVLANNATIPFDSKSNVTGLWTDAVIYSGAALIGGLGGGPVVTGTGDFASGNLVPTIIASISASMATGLLGSDQYLAKAKDPSSPGATMYWFHTVTRSQSTQILFDKAWPSGQQFYDPFWKTMADLTNMQGYLSPFNDRWANFSPDFNLWTGYKATWKLGISSSSTGYSVGGTVSGDVQKGVTITLTGASSLTKTTTTAADGTYSFTGLTNGKYTLVPSLATYTFSPTNSSVTISGANITGQNFQASTVKPSTYSISGTVSGDKKEDVTVTLTGVSSATATTGTDGTYSFTNLADGGYTVTPSCTGYTFTPASSSVTIAGANQTGKDFVSAAVKPSAYSISGNVSGDTQKGVTITLGGDSSGTTTTDDSGAYSFANLPNGSYLLTPSLSGYTFSPINSSVTIAGASQSGQNFVAKAVAPSTYTISGKVTGDVIEDVTITLAGGASATTTTGIDGSYAFTNLTDGSYTVTPSLTGFTFDPASRSVTLTGGDRSGQDFAANDERMAYGLEFVIEATEVTGLPTPGKFMVAPKVYTMYDFGGKTGVKANVTLLTKVDKKVGAASVDCEWTKNIKLYNSTSFKNAQKQGVSAAEWAKNTSNQKDLHMDLRLSSKEAKDQSIRPTGLALPVISGVSVGEKTSKGEATLVLVGQWFGSKTPKVWREYTDKGAVKQQTMKVLKPTDAAYKDVKGKPSFMNALTGESKAIVVVPSKLPKGPLNSIIVMDNGVGLATGVDPSN